MENNKDLDKLKDKFENNRKKSNKKQLESIEKEVKNIKKETNNKKKKNINNKDNYDKKKDINNEEEKVNSNKKDEEINKKINNITEKEKNSKFPKKDVVLKNDKEKINDNKIETKKKLKYKKKKLKRNKKKKKKLILIVSLIIILVLLISGLIYFLNEEEKERIRLENIRKEKEEQALITEINNHYNSYVITNKDTIIYNKKEEEIGKIASNIELSLEEIEIDKNTKYFKVKDFDDTYIKYQDVNIIDSLSITDTRYKKYILFNENIVTNDKTIFYDSDNNLVYDFNKSFDLPIIIKDTDRYGVEYNGRLLYVKQEDIKEIKDNYNTDLNNASGVAVLNYHAFYDETNSVEVANCPTSICHSKKQFRQHLDYFRENNIFTLTMNEMEMYIDGKIKLPKSVLITIDDGGRTEHAVDMLTEYKMNGTIFLVTAWFNPEEFYKSDYIELHSHSHNLHDGGQCPGGQGGAIKCLNRQTLLEDLRTSRELLNNTTAFCFPFYEFNEYSISVLKEAGFTMAFIGERGDMLVKVGDDKFRLTRFVIHKGTTMYALDNYFDSIKN